MLGLGGMERADAPSNASLHAGELNCRGFAHRAHPSNTLEDLVTPSPPLLVVTHIFELSVVLIWVLLRNFNRLDSQGHFGGRRAPHNGL